MTKSRTEMLNNKITFYIVRCSETNATRIKIQVCLRRYRYQRRTSSSSDRSWLREFFKKHNLVHDVNEFIFRAHIMKTTGGRWSSGIITRRAFVGQGEVVGSTPVREHEKLCLSLKRDRRQSTIECSLTYGVEPRLTRPARHCTPAGAGAW